MSVDVQQQRAPDAPVFRDQEGRARGAAEVKRQLDLETDTFLGCLRPAFAEFTAALFFSYLSLGAVSATGAFGMPAGTSLLTIALAFGFSFFVLSWAVGHISGGHINPVITMVFMFVRKISFIRGLLYLFAQLAGYLCGAALLRASMPLYWDVAGAGTAANCFGNTLVNGQVGIGRGILVEIVITAMFLFVVCAATDQYRSNQVMVPLAMGMAVTIGQLMALTSTGASMNPFRSFASAVVSNSIKGCGDVWDDHWVFWVGPIIGAFVGGLWYEFSFFDGGIRGEHPRLDLVRSYRYDYYERNWPAKKENVVAV